MTIAFSTKSLDWKTEYSFEPFGYNATRDTMISFKRSYAESGVHTHDTNSLYNTFYGTNYPSKLSVISNEDPSATKIYEAFSLESTEGNWSATFTTDTGEQQRSFLPTGGLTEREGKHYAEVPKNTLNKDMMLSYVGETTLFDLANAAYDQGSPNKIKLKSRIQAVPGRALAFTMPQLSDEHFEDTVFSASSFSPGTYRYHLGGGSTDFKQEFNPQPTFSAYSSGWGYDPYTNSITHTTIETSTGEDATSDLQPFLDSGIITFAFYPTDLLSVMTNSIYTSVSSYPELADIPISIHSISYVDVDGEDMRGEYMKVDMQRSGTDYYELYAINLDQHKTKLDHSLGQNN
jgi:hypothetical protein|tara:strand:- start:838 stop:1878 length:1041 start_codon:yes stop_codon:yes gene_type:complete